MERKKKGENSFVSSVSSSAAFRKQSCLLGGRSALTVLWTCFTGSLSLLSRRSNSCGYISQAVSLFVIGVDSPVDMVHKQSVSSSSALLVL